MISECLSPDIFVKSTRKVKEEPCLKSRSPPSILKRSSTHLNQLSVPPSTRYLDESLAVAIYSEPGVLKPEPINSLYEEGHIFGLSIFVYRQKTNTIFGNLRAFERK